MKEFHKFELKFISMKRKLLIASVFVFIAVGFASCEKTCETCKIVTRDSSGNIVGSPGAGAEYCGIELTTFKAANPKITDPITKNVTQVECN
jgi:hypothetical protein